MREFYEVVLPGFDGGTDETDNLVKWVACSRGGDFVRAQFPEATVTKLDFGGVFGGSWLYST